VTSVPRHCIREALDEAAADLSHKRAPDFGISDNLCQRTLYLPHEAPPRPLARAS